MRPTSRRELLRAGAAIGIGVGSVALSGCSSEESTRRDTESESEVAVETELSGSSTPADSATASDIADRIPGIQSGEVVDARELAAAHERKVTARSAKLSESRTVINLQSGLETLTGEIQALIDGDRILAKLRGREQNGLPEVVTRRLYIEGTDFFIRDTVATDSSTDTTETRRVDPYTDVVTRGRTTGRARLLESLPEAELSEQLDSDFFTVEKGVTDAGALLPVRASATLDQSGLCRDWTASVDVGANDNSRRRNHVGRLTKLFDVVVERPDWVRDLI